MAILLRELGTPDDSHWALCADMSLLRETLKCAARPVILKVHHARVRP